MKKILLSALLAGALVAGWQDMLGNAVKQYSGSQKNAGSTTATSLPGTTKESSAIKEALEIGVKKAVDTLGKKGGFYDNPLVKIPLPKNVQMVGDTLKKAGMGKYVERFELSMNRAAEEAVPETAKVLAETIKEMKLEDAKKIVTGPDNAATEYFKTHAGEKLAKKIAPIIKKHMENENVTKYYQTMMEYYNQYGKRYTSNKYAQAALGALGMGGKGSAMPKEDEKDLTTYVTNRTLEGLYKMIEEQERAIRKNPAARATKLLQEVFGGK